MSNFKYMDQINLYILDYQNSVKQTITTLFKPKFIKIHTQQNLPNNPNLMSF